MDRNHRCLTLEVFFHMALNKPAVKLSVTPEHIITANGFLNLLNNSLMMIQPATANKITGSKSTIPIITE